MHVFFSLTPVLYCFSHETQTVLSDCHLPSCSQSSESNNGVWAIRSLFSISYNSTESILVIVTVALNIHKRCHTVSHHFQMWSYPTSERKPFCKPSCVIPPEQWILVAKILRIVYLEFQESDDVAIPPCAWKDTLTPFWVLTYKVAIIQTWRLFIGRPCVAPWSVFQRTCSHCPPLLGQHGWCRSYQSASFNCWNEHKWTVEQSNKAELVATPGSKNNLAHHHCPKVQMVEV